MTDEEMEPLSFHPRPADETGYVVYLTTFPPEPYSRLGFKFRGTDKANPKMIGLAMTAEIRRKVRDRYGDKAVYVVSEVRRCYGPGPEMTGDGIYVVPLAADDPKSLR